MLYTKGEWPARCHAQRMWPDLTDYRIVFERREKTHNQATISVFENEEQRFPSEWLSASGSELIVIVNDRTSKSKINGNLYKLSREVQASGYMYSYTQGSIR